MNPKRLDPAEPASARLRNWAGNLVYGTDQVLRPSSVAELQEMVHWAARLKLLGSRHCFNGIADSDHLLISTERLTGIVGLDLARREVTVEAGVTYGRLGAFLHERGFALHNLASLPHISVVGAVTTATHGSGLGNGSLATAVTGFELITADGTIRRCTAEIEGSRFEGMVVHLGALGAVSRITLKIEPTFAIAQTVYLGLPLATAIEHFRAIMGAGYSVSLFTDWATDRINEVWIKRRADRPVDWAPEFYGATRAPHDVHPIAGISAENCTPQGGVAGPWHERLPHFRLGFTPSGGEELQSEYFVPLERAAEALDAIQQLQARISPLLLTSELRTVAADRHWLSMANERASLGIHFTWKQDWPAVRQVLPQIEQALRPFGARPHWGKLFTMAADEVRSRYPRFGDFAALVREWDPAGKFRNAYLRDVIGSDLP